MLRICPGCKSSLNSFDYYFCSKCGATLPLEVIKPLSSDRINVKEKRFVPTTTSAAPVRKITHYKALAICMLASIAVFSLVFTQYSYLFNFAQPEIQNPVINRTNSDQESQLIFNSNFSYKEGSFLRNNYAMYVPSDIAFFAEFKDITWIKELDDPTFSEYETLLKVLVGDNFAYYIDASGNWAVILDVKNEKELQNLLNLISSDVWEYKFYKNILYLSNSQDLIDSSVMAADQLTLNLSLNGEYVKKEQNLIKQGQARVFIFNRSVSFDHLKSLNLKNKEFVLDMERIGYNEFVIKL